MDFPNLLQKKTDRPVRFEQTDETRQETDEHLRLAGRMAGQFSLLVAAIGLA
jgi:hypothetical protein